jgi:hypothetical protein
MYHLEDGDSERNLRELGVRKEPKEEKVSRKK